MSPIRVGEPDVRLDAPTHVPLNPRGNTPRPRWYKAIRERGHHKDGQSSARRSTGVDSHTKNSVVLGAPNLSPP